MKTSPMVTELQQIQECLEKNNQNCKVRKGEQLFLYTTRRHDLIHIPIKLHEDIPNGYCVMAHTRMFEKNQRGITWKLRKGEQSFL